MGFKFEKLQVWQKAIRLSLHVHELTREFPKEELYVLTAQVKRAADSVALNPAIAPRPLAVGGTVVQQLMGGRDVAHSGRTCGCPETPKGCPGFNPRNRFAISGDHGLCPWGSTEGSHGTTAVVVDVVVGPVRSGDVRAFAAGGARRGRRHLRAAHPHVAELGDLSSGGGRVVGACAEGARRRINGRTGLMGKMEPSVQPAESKKAPIARSG